MEVRELKYISEIAKTKHMQQAAQNLYISQPALHKALRKVEEELHTSLFYREKNELLPTDTGRVVLESAAHIADELRRMNDSILAVRNLQQGTVSFGYPTVIGAVYLAKHLDDFQKKYSNITLKTVEGGSPKLIDLVSSGKLDTAVVMGPILSRDLNEIPLIHDQIVVGVQPDHPLADRTSLTARDLEDIPFNTLVDSYTVHTRLMQRFHEANVKPSVAFTSVSCHFLYEISRLSGDALIIPGSIIRSFAGNTMKLIPFDPAYPWDVCLIFRKNTFVSNAATALIRHMQNLSAGFSTECNYEL